MPEQPQAPKPEPPQEPVTSQQIQNSQPAHRFGWFGKSQPGQDRSRLRKWDDHVEELLNEARERGEFENLRGAGEPLHLEKNIYAGDKALAYSLLKNNNIAPPEIERGKEIDSELQRAEALLTTLRHRRNTLRVGRSSAFSSDRRAYNLLRDKTETRYAEALRSVNSKILSLNIVAPAALHRRMIDLDARLAAFHDEFPRLDE